MRINRLLLQIFFFICWIGQVLSQSSYYIKAKIIDYPEESELHDKWKNQTFDSLNAILQVQNLLTEYLSSAYLEASIDSIQFKDSTMNIWVHKGPQYKFADIIIEEEYQSILSKAGYQINNINNNEVRLSYISSLFNNIITVLENSGFPFASIQFSDFKSENGLFSGSLNISRGRFITMDTINLYGLDIVNKNYLNNYLQIQPGDTYNAEEILKIKDKINNLSFLELSEDPSIRFYGDKAMINLKLKERNASRFDFIIGILPGNSSEQRYTISGDVNFEIQNKLKQGEQLAINYERLKPETQQLEISARYPFLINLPFGLDTEFNLFRNENTNRDLNFSFGVLYQLSANNFLKAFWNTQSSRLIEIDTASILSTGKLPSRLDVITRNFGIQGLWQNLDYRFNPRKGYSIIARGTAGQKNIIPSNAILELKSDKVDFSSSYDSLNLSSYQFKFNLDSEFFIPIMKRSTLKTAVSAGKIVSGQRVFQNEYYRIGGNDILRGFDEESISGEFFSVLTLEYRLLLSRNSFLSTFLDYGIRQNNYDSENKWDRPYGIGGGFSLETASGIFGISVAVGSQKGNPLDFRNVKTHMGFLGLF